MSDKEFVIYKKPILYNQIVFEDTHAYCLNLLMNGKPCPAYKQNWACPPYSPTYLQTKERLLHYTSFLIILYEYNLVYRQKYLHAKHPDWDQKKIEQNALNSHLYNSTIYWGLRKILKPYIKASGMLGTYVLGNSNCRLCAKCARKTNEPCRHPTQRIYSMEAAGINVDQSLRNIGYVLEWPPTTKVVQVGLIVFRELNPPSSPQKVAEQQS